MFLQTGSVAVLLRVSWLSSGVMGHLGCLPRMLQRLAQAGLGLEDDEVCKPPEAQKQHVAVAISFTTWY